MKKTNRSSMADFLQDESITALDGEYSALDSESISSSSEASRSYVKYLSNVDYSLNSPLLQDELLEFLKFSQGKPHRKSWNLQTWKLRRDVFRQRGISWEDVVPPNKFHEWFGKKNLASSKSHTRFLEVLELAQKDADLTYPIVDSFFRGWIQKVIPNPDKTKCPTQILKWGSYFLDMHILTLILNARDEGEIAELLKIEGVRRYSRLYPTAIIFHSSNFGRAVIMKEFCYLSDEKVLLDRNTLLMCKDTYVARFQTLFSMINRVDHCFNPMDWMRINDVYKVGDIMLARSGNQAYDSIKMVEAISSLRVSELARMHRPLIPDFPEYREHILQSVAELEAIIPGTQHLYQTILQLDTPELALTVYGVFRHWGHPYLDYLEGLRSMYEQVTVHKEIDEDYAQKLASDLAHIVLKKKFTELKQWYVNSAQVQDNHPFRSHITEQTWPTPKQILDFGDRWHLLPLRKCFEIPDMLDPSIIYADKSHSLNKSEILEHVKRHPYRSIPTRKVLESLLNKPETNWVEFLSEVERQGLSSEDLVIGLKGKEREIKIKGRYFSLMSWRLREYFVVTEYLIKTHFVPLFSGLTMADDLNTVIKKLIDNTSGQGNDDYEYVCIANHIDYTKWNNHQRGAANNPVFVVMDKFLGFQNLISRTHQFFEQSTIYFNQRPDLMEVRDGVLGNKGPDRVTWNGQLGGFEGLRQKGWSVTNLLVIRRESFDRNTKISILAQGDNQVICGKYKIQKTRTEDELRTALAGIVRENQNIMRAIERGTGKLGLIINRDETLQSADLLIYGKVPIYRGSIRGLEAKRWSRVTCVTNDQLPTLANTMSSISSNSLTVAHFSNSPLNAIVHYNFLGNFGRILLEIHNPALKSQVRHRVRNPTLLTSVEYKGLVLYLDPCLGGACGMSLTRFLIRGFPDPLTESLAFWKFVHTYGVRWVKDLAVQVGYPAFSHLTTDAFKKLLEDPACLNISGGVNPLSMIKEEIKLSLIHNSGKINNQIMKSAIRYLHHHEGPLIDYLRSIKPLFPRFVSEYLSGTYLGIVQGLVGLFQNSKTIRTVFSRNISTKISKIIVQSEIQTIEGLCRVSKRSRTCLIWDCSSAKADKLRTESWGEPVYGATIPHPIELLTCPIRQQGLCPSCEDYPPTSYYLSILVPHGLHRYKTVRGPYKAYLGSHTSETTSVLRPWEREAKIPLIKRAAKLRSAIGWFVEKDSKLGLSIIQNLEALTGECWLNKIEGAKRTGSALHRFSCSRQSGGGYAALSPAKLGWMCMTTDTLSTLNAINHDFMHQSLLLYSQATVAEVMDDDPSQGYFHSHIKCTSCLREIKEITLETVRDFTHEDVSDILEKWKPENTPWSYEYPLQEIKLGNWNLLSPMVQSFHIGRACGFLYGDLKMSNDHRSEDSSLFPLSLQAKVSPRDFLQGVLDGLVRASSIHCVSRRTISELKRPREALLGVGLYLISEISNQAGLITMWRSDGFNNLFLEIPYKVPPSYPLSNRDLGSLGRSYLRSEYIRIYVNKEQKLWIYPNIWIFADINDVKLFGLLSLSTRLVKHLYRGSLQKSTKNLIRSSKDIIIHLKDPDRTNHNLSLETAGMFRVDEEIRHASKFLFIPPPSDTRKQLKWGRELSVPVLATPIPYISPSLVSEQSKVTVYIPRCQNPLISGLRCFQFATGSHYKIQSIIEHFRIKYSDALSGGDGSGGIASYLIRSNQQARVIFNSLLILDNVDLRGASPSPPSAISALGFLSKRCVNLKDVWENPSDLSLTATWEYFLHTRDRLNLDIDLVILDMECKIESVSDQIEKRLAEYVFKILPDHGTLIYKTFLSRILQKSSIFLSEVGCQFYDVYCVATAITSSQSSEVYMVCRQRGYHHYKTSPDLRLLLEKIQQYPSMCSLEEEFIRALQLTSYDMYQGIPQELITNHVSELAIMLETLGVEVGVTAVLEEVLKTYENSLIPELPYLVLFLALNSLLSLTAGYLDCPIPPSDPKVYNTGCLILGFLNWSAIATNQFLPHKNAQSMIKHSFPLSWMTRRIRYKSGQRKGKIVWLRFYSFSTKYPHRKVFHMDANMARIGQMTRCLYRTFQCLNGPIDTPKLNKALKMFNDNLTLDLIHKRCDISELFLHEQFPPDDATSGMWETMAQCEVGWMS